MNLEIIFSTLINFGQQEKIILKFKETTTLKILSIYLVFKNLGSSFWIQIIYKNLFNQDMSKNMKNIETVTTIYYQVNHLLDPSFMQEPLLHPHNQ